MNGTTMNGAANCYEATSASSASSTVGYHHAHFAAYQQNYCYPQAATTTAAMAAHAAHVHMMTKRPSHPCMAADNACWAPMPHKRARRASASLVAECNNRGVLHYESGRYREAMDAFRRAHRMATSASAYSASEAAADVSGNASRRCRSMSFFSDCSFASSSAAAYEQQQQRLHASQSQGGWPTVDPAALAVTYESAPSQHEQIQSEYQQGPQQPQRSEYDEGIHSFGGTLRIDGGAVDGIEEEGAKAYLIPPVLHNMGRVYHQWGRNEEALDLYNRSLTRLDQLGLKETGTTSGGIIDAAAVRLACLHGIGQIHYSKGDHSSALDAYAVALSLSRAAYGEASLDAAACMNCIGVLRYHMPASEGAAGSSSGEDGSSSDGNGGDALDCFRSSLRVRRQILGADHPDVGTTWNNLGRVHFQRSEYDAALSAYAEALRVRRLSCGPRHVDVAATTFNIGQAYHQTGRSEEAMECYEAFAAIVRATFGRDHRDLAIVTTCIGQLHHEAKRYEEALASYGEALRVARAALGSDHPEVAITLNKLGNLHYERGDMDAALEIYGQGLRVETAVLDPRNPNIVVTLTNIAEIYRQREEYAEAHGLYVRALALQRANLGPDHADVANTLSSIGYVLHQSGDHSGSLEAYQDCLRIRREAAARAGGANSEESSSEIAATLTHIALVLLKKDMQDMALEVLLESYRIRKVVQERSAGSGEEGYKGMGRDLAFTLYNIAVIHHHRGMYEYALAYYRETARVERSSLGTDHRDLGITLYNMGQIYYQTGEYESALRHYRKALRIERESFGDDHPTCARTWNEIGNIELQRGNAGPMMEAFSEAARIYRKAGMSDDCLVVYGKSLYGFEVVHPNAAGAA